VVVTCPLTKETHHLFDRERFVRMKPSAWLFALDNLVLTPHLAGMTVESRSRMSEAAAEEMLRMLAGKRRRTSSTRVTQGPRMKIADVKAFRPLSHPGGESRRARHRHRGEARRRGG